MTEEECLSPQSGAFVHIRAGIDELSKHFEIGILTNKKSSNLIVNNNFSAIKPNMPRASSSSGSGRKSVLKGTLSDIKKLITNILELPYFFKFIKANRPQFIYERAAYLNFNALIVSRILKIPHFYEVNGVLSKDAKMYYKSLLNEVCGFLEKKAYQRSTLNFCVGGVGEELKLRSSGYISVQNGIKENLLRFAKNACKTNYDSSQIHICYVGYIMKHHDANLLISALSNINHDDVHIHFFGRGFERVMSSLPSHVKCTNHGIVTEADLIPLLFNCHLAVIPQMQKEGSNMKIFTYAAGKLLIILPKYPNVSRIFENNKHVLFFEPNSISDCLDKIAFAIKNRNVIRECGENLYDYVSANFTWEKVFERVALRIKSYL